jgi:hypothetical protein
MGQPVKLSDDLIREARTVGAVARRSIAGQVEFWARLGKSIETRKTETSGIETKRSFRRDGKLICGETTGAEGRRSDRPRRSETKSVSTCWRVDSSPELQASGSGGSAAA